MDSFIKLVHGQKSLKKYIVFVDAAHVFVGQRIKLQNYMKPTKHLITSEMDAEY